MKTIQNWKAKRAGGRITVYGVTETGEAIRVAGVDKIERETGEPTPIATDKNGVRYALA